MKMSVQYDKHKNVKGINTWVKHIIHAMPNIVCGIWSCTSTLIILSLPQLFTSLWRKLKHTSIPEVQMEAKICQEKCRVKPFESGAALNTSNMGLEKKNIKLRLTSEKRQVRVREREKHRVKHVSRVLQLSVIQDVSQQGYDTLNWTRIKGREIFFFFLNWERGETEHEQVNKAERKSEGAGGPRGNCLHPLVLLCFKKKCCKSAL